MSTSKAAVPALGRIEVHYRSFLNTRWIGLVVRSAVLTSVSFFLVPGLLLGWDYSILSALGTLFIAGPFVHLAALALVLRVRRSLIISPPKLAGAPTTRGIVSGTFTPAVLALLGANFVFGLVFTWAYAAALAARSSSVQLGWFNSTHRYPHHANERLWFLVFGNASFFVLLAFRDVVNARLGPVWPTNTRVRFPDSVVNALKACFTGVHADSTFGRDASNALSWTVVYSAAYFMLRGWVWRTLITHIPITRPFVINFVKSSRSNMSWTLSWYLLVLQLTALLAYKPALAVLNDYLTQPLNFGAFTRKSPLTPERYLLAAMTSPNQFYVDHTILEMQRLAHTTARRQAVFADNSKPALVYEIWRTLLVQLGQANATVTSRGGAIKKPAPPAPIGPLHPDEHALALKTGNVFLPPKPASGLKRLVGDALKGTPRPTPAPVVDAVQAAVQVEHDLLRAAEKPVHAAEEWATNTPFLGPLLSSAKFARGGFSTWVGDEWVRRCVFAAVPEQDRLARVVDILATFVVASADEDSLGYVQAVLPSTLEALVRVRRAASSLGAELQATTPKTPGVDGSIRSHIGAITGVIDAGILRIAERFGNTLTAFRFPSDIALELTDICRVAP